MVNAVLLIMSVMVIISDIVMLVDWLMTENAEKTMIVISAVLTIAAFGPAFLMEADYNAAATLTALLLLFISMLTSATSLKRVLTEMNKDDTQNEKEDL